MSDILTEGSQFILRYINAPPKSIEERVKVGQQVAVMLVQREGELRHLHGMNTFMLGGLVHVLKKDELWKQFDVVKEDWKFSDFCEEVLNTSLQRANAHVRIWERSQFIGLEPEEVDRIGWNAAQHLIRVAQNRDDVEHWLDVHNQCETQEEFVDKIRSEINQREGKTESQEEPPQMEERFVRFSSSQDSRFYDQCVSIATEALEKERKRSISNVEAVLFIFSEWRASCDPKFFERK